MRRLLFCACLVAVLGSLSLPASALWTPAWFTYSGHQYALTMSQTSWWDNEAQAVYFGGHLVAVNSAAENEWLAQTFANTYCTGYEGNASGALVHIGYYFNYGDQQWEWISGEPVTYTNLYSGFPQGGDLAYMHVVPHGDASHSWNCNPPHTYGPNYAYGVMERVPEPSGLLVLLASVPLMARLLRRKRA